MKRLLTVPASTYPKPKNIDALLENVTDDELPIMSSLSVFVVVSRSGLSRVEYVATFSTRVLNILASEFRSAVFTWFEILKVFRSALHQTDNFIDVC